MTNLNYIFVLIFLNLIFENYGYIIPTPNFEVLPTKNILVTVPDKKGLQMLIFHGAINRKIKIYESGDYEFTKRMKKNIHNNWICELPSNYNQSDTIYYWVYAQYNSEGFWQKEMNIQLKTITQKPIDPDKICLKTITEITGSQRQICKDHLIFEETFDIYDTTKWEREIKFNGYDGEFVLYENNSQNLYIKDGNLHIVPTLTVKSGYEKIIGINEVDLGSRCTEEEQRDYFCRRNAEYRILPPITSAKIRTKNSFAFRYGRIDVRAKLPKGDWIFPQIFLEPLKNAYASRENQEYLGGQMRIAFIRGNEVLYDPNTHTLYHGSILNGGVILQDLGEFFIRKLDNHQHLGNNYHNYSILWTNNEIKFFIDERLYAKFDNSFLNVIPTELLNNREVEPFKQPFYISLGVGVGGYSNFPDNVRTSNNKKKPWQNDEPNGEKNFWSANYDWAKTWTKNNKLIVDYVKVFAV